jgi:hypothetical protein
MLDQVPFSLDVLFIVTTLVTMGLFIASVMRGSTETVRRRAHPVALLLLMWMIFQSTLALNRWYMDREATPPNLVFPLATAGSIYLLLFILPAGRRFMDGVHAGTLALLHVVRIPVEIALYLLATWKQVPWSMTFSGYNFDILAGVSALAIWWFGYRKNKLSAPVLLTWNVLSLGLLAFIVIRSAGALPSPLQAWDFSQPNYAMMHFPYVWLPSVIVPLVLFSHLVLIRRALKSMR